MSVLLKPHSHESFRKRTMMLLPQVGSVSPQNSTTAFGTLIISCSPWCFHEHYCIQLCFVVTLLLRSRDKCFHLAEENKEMERISVPQSHVKLVKGKDRL